MSLILYRNTDNIHEKILPGCTQFINAMEVLMKFAENMPIDRTGTFKGRYDTKVRFPIPEIPKSFKMTWADCMLQRVEELTATNKKVVVAWSGGIDSTAVVAAFFLAGKQSQMKVIFEPRSLGEYQKFYTEFVSKVEHLQLDYHVSQYKPLPDEILTTGDPGDCLFGKFTECTNKSLWRDWVVRQEVAPMNQLLFLIDQMEAFVAKSPVEIVTVNDFFWWVNFAMKWDGMMGKFNRLRFIPKEEYDRILHFYNTEYFQLWSMTNHDKKIKDKRPTFKYVAKDFIFKLTKDKEYTLLKQKFGSHKPDLSADTTLNNPFNRHNLLMAGELPVLIDEDYTHYSFLDLGPSLVRFMNPVDTAEWIRK